MKFDTKHCDKLEEYLDNVLPKPDMHLFETHLNKCSECREQVQVSKFIRAQHRTVRKRMLPDHADLGIRIALRRKRAVAGPGKDVMNLEEAAEWLGITPAALAERLDEIPSFEIGGHVRFSRQRLEKWMEMKDSDMWLQLQHSHRRKDCNILHFPGGNHDKQQSGNSSAV